MTDLLPCPFCGEKPFERLEKNPNGPKYPDHWTVWCENLECTASPGTFEETQEASRVAWNTRTLAPAQSPARAEDGVGWLSDYRVSIVEECARIVDAQAEHTRRVIGAFAYSGSRHSLIADVLDDLAKDIRALSTLPSTNRGEGE